MSKLETVVLIGYKLIKKSIMNTINNIISLFYIDEQNPKNYKINKIKTITDKIFGRLKNRHSIDFLSITLCSEIILKILQISNKMVIEYRQEIIEIFESEDFYKCSIEGLQIWGQIMVLMLDNSSIDIFNDYFEK